MTPMRPTYAPPQKLSRPKTMAWPRQNLTDRQVWEWYLDAVVAKDVLVPNEEQE